MRIINIVLLLLLLLESGLKNPDIRIILDGKATKENCTHKNIKCQWQ